MPNRKLPYLISLLLVIAGVAATHQLFAGASAAPPIEVYPLTVVSGTTTVKRWAFVRSVPPQAVAIITPLANKDLTVSPESVLDDKTWTQNLQQKLNSQASGKELWQVALAQVESDDANSPLFQRRSPDVWLTLWQRNKQVPTLMAVTESGIESSLLQGKRGARKISPIVGEFLKLSPQEKDSLDGTINRALQEQQTTLELVGSDRRLLRVFLEPTSESKLAQRLLAAALPETPNIDDQPSSKPPHPSSKEAGPSHPSVKPKPHPSLVAEWWPVALGALVLLVAVLIVGRTHLLLLLQRLHGAFLRVSSLLNRHPRPSSHDSKRATQEDLWFFKFIGQIHEAAVLAEQPGENQALRLAALDISIAAWQRAAQAVADSGELPRLFAQVRPAVARWIFQEYHLGDRDNPGELIDAGRAAIGLWRRQQSEQSEMAKLDSARDFLNYLNAELLRLRAAEKSSQKLIEELKNGKSLLDEQYKAAADRVKALEKGLEKADAEKTAAEAKASQLTTERDLLETEKGKLTKRIAELDQQHERDEQRLAALAAGRETWQIKAAERANKLPNILRAADLVRDAQIRYWDKTQHPASTAVFLYIRYLALYQLLAGIEGEDPVSETVGWINLYNLLSWIEHSGVTNVRASDLELLHRIDQLEVHPQRYLKDDPELILNARVLDHMTSGTSERGFNPAKLRAGSSWPILFRVDNNGMVGRAT
jgi:hypothetical protein